MIINSIKITNFRCYYGTNSLSFNSDGKITLIYGKSGRGKSSLLQFFKWMFYGDLDFGPKNDFPVFNVPAYKECAIGDTIKVSGQIDFEHLGTVYRLNRTNEYDVSIRMENAVLKHYDYKLLIKGDDDSYHAFSGDISNQINSILPKELSKYFLLEGEHSRDIVLDSNELKKAIFSLFGLDAYNDAIFHIGTSRNAKKTVLGYYAAQMAANSTTIGSMSIQDLQDASQDLYEEIETLKNKRKDLVDLIKQKNTRRDEIIKQIGSAAFKDNLTQLIKEKQSHIKDNEKHIQMLQHSIGDLFYQVYPYLFLAKVTSESASFLRKKNNEYASNYKNIFENLKKDLLKEILNKNVCVCGRQLDDASVDHIAGLIKIMPPDSYTYTFGQFVSKAKNQIRQSQTHSMKYEEISSSIAQYESENQELEEEIRQKIEEASRLEVKNLVEELDVLKLELDKLDKQKSELDSTIGQKQLYYEAAGRKLSNALKNATISGQYREKVDFFEKVSGLLQEEKDKKVVQIRVLLDNCVREVFKELTTQKEVNADTVQFVNDDFSLRTTYLSGGQQAVDVFSYVIGIVKALQQFNAENSDNPIIIDAPFAFTDDEQSEHIFRTLPTVSKQTVLLTLDLNKTRELLSSHPELYDFYEIQSSVQSVDRSIKACIIRGDINDIKF